MANTIRTPLSERPLGRPQDILPFLNKEAIPLLREMRAALNGGIQTFYASVNTAASPSTWTTIWESEPVPSGRVGLVEILVVGHDVTPYSYGARKSRLYVSDGGVLAGVAQVTIYEHVTAPPMDSRIFFDTTNEVVKVQVMDIGVEADFTAMIQVLEVAQ